VRRAVFAALLSHWRRNPLQLFTLIAGLALGTALWAGVQAINTEARTSYDQAASSATQYAQILPQNGQFIAMADYIALRRAGWLVSPVITGDLAGVTLLGIDPLTAPQRIGGQRGGATVGGPQLGAEGMDLAAFLSGPGQILARAEILAKLQPKLQPKLPQGPLGIVRADMAPDTAVTDIGTAQSLLGRAGQIDRLVVAKVQPLTRRPLAEVAAHLTLTEEATDVARLTESFHLNLTAFGFLAFAVGLFIVHGAIGLAFAQRRVMVRSLRAMGVPLRTMIGLMLAELMVLAAVAGAVGVGLGYVVAAALLPDVAASLRGLYGAELGDGLAFRAQWWLPSLGIAIGGAGLAGVGALRALAGMPLLASAQPQAFALSRRGRLLVAALVLLATALGLAIWGRGLVAGFASLGALLIGGALILPSALSGMLRLCGAGARGPVAQWFWADTRQQLPSLSLALMALMLAMAANVGVSTMVSSFRLTFVGFLDQRLASEAYVSATDAAQAARIAAVAQQYATALLPIISADKVIAGQPAQIYGVIDHSTYRDNWRFLDSEPQAWASVAGGQGALVNEQLFRRAGLGLGDILAITPDLSLPIVGIYGDYGNPIGQVIVAKTLFDAAFPDAIALRFGLRVNPADMPALRLALQDQAGLAQGAMMDQAAIKSLSLQVFERTFTVTRALNVLTLAVAGFAMLMSLLTLADMRLPMLAPVWALGITRQRLAGLDMARAIVLAALTGALGLPLGLALAWALLAVVNVEAFGWRLPMYLFWMDYLRLGGLALLAAALAGFWPAWRLSHMAPARLLGVFRHER
jgi:putative ABC transport system permease protein